MTHCLFMQGVQALTAELTVRFISPVCTGDKLMVCARLLGQRRGIYQLEAWLTKGQQKVARATAKFIVRRRILLWRIASVTDDRCTWLL
jgi:acyl-coenzyme A thioesterase PaaI-like protein